MIVGLGPIELQANVVTFFVIYECTPVLYEYYDKYIIQLMKENGRNIPPSCGKIIVPILTICSCSFYLPGFYATGYATILDGGIKCHGHSKKFIDNIKNKYHNLINGLNN